jgi:hypothetical protein
MNMRDLELLTGEKNSQSDPTVSRHVCGGESAQHVLLYAPTHLQQFPGFVGGAVLYCLIHITLQCGLWLYMNVGAYLSGHSTWTLLT